MTESVSRSGRPATLTAERKLGLAREYQADRTLTARALAEREGVSIRTIQRALAWAKGKRR